MNEFDITLFEAVIFDMDSTLTNTHNYPVVASDWLLTKSGVDSEEIKGSFLRNLFIRYTTAIQTIVEGAPYRSASEIVHTAMKNSMEDIDHLYNPKLIDEATERFKTLHLELSVAHDGVAEMLEKLKAQEIKLGVISNSFSGHAKIILNKLELADFFSSIVDCGDVRAFKPMKAIFERALHDLNTEGSRALYVGDEYYADMVGAKSVGMTTVWINHRGRSLEDLIAKYGVPTTPDFVLKSIIEFAELL
ncbi:MAG: HAD family hydrolase [Candidatus Thorarchaeota archaeon]